MLSEAGAVKSTMESRPERERIRDVFGMAIQDSKIDDDEDDW